MQQTTKYQLNKPDGTDVADIAVLNENADKIEAALITLGVTPVTAALYGLGAGAVPDGVLNIIAQNLMVKKPLYFNKLVQVTVGMTNPSVNTHQSLDDIGLYDIVFSSITINAKTGNGQGGLYVRGGFHSSMVGAGAGIGATKSCLTIKSIQVPSTVNGISITTNSNPLVGDLNQTTSHGANATVTWTTGTVGDTVNYTLCMWGIKL